MAAVRTGRRWCGYDTDPAYVDLARRRVADEVAPLELLPVARTAGPPAAAKVVAEELLVAAGFTVVQREMQVTRLGLTVDLVVDGADGRRWSVDISGALTVTRAGLARTDEAWRAIGRASVLVAHGLGPVLLLSSHLPRKGDKAHKALQAAGLDAVGLTSPDAPDRLRAYACGTEPSRPA